MTDAVHDHWVLVDYSVPNEDAELFADRLWTLGVVAVEERDRDAQSVTLRTSMGEDPSRVIETLRQEFPTVGASLVKIAKNVTESWRDHAHVTAITDDIMLVPAWLTAPAGSRPVYIEPLDTFGLGNHPTTVLTLQLALQFVSEHQRIFDFGCGSGVLAVSMARLVGNQCDVFDIAESARSAVEMNAALNNVSSVTWNEHFEDNAYDIVLANILAPVLREESSTIKRLLRKGGRTVLSGMRVDQVEGVLASYDGFAEIARRELDGWSAVVLEKNS